MFDPNGVEYLNQFAIVSYINEPLSRFLDRLRCELVPNCFLRAHITIVPPRPLSFPPEKAWNQARQAVYGLSPVDIELAGIEVFPVSDVIYVALSSGRERLMELHGILNSAALAHDEPFPFHPHITLAQNLTSDQVDELSQVARRRWAEYDGPRTFRVETITFVQNTRWRGWVDHAETTLGWGVKTEENLVEA